MKQLFYGSSNNYVLLLLKRSTFLLCKVYVGHAARAYPCTRSVIGQQLAQLFWLLQCAHCVLVWYWLAIILISRH